MIRQGYCQGIDRVHTRRIGSADMETEPRSKLLMVKLKQSEWAKLQELAAADNAASISDFVRRRSLKEPVPA